MNSVSVSIDLMSKMHAAIEAARAYRTAETQTAGDKSDDATFHRYEAQQDLDMALDDYDRAGKEVRCDG